MLQSLFGDPVYFVIWILSLVTVITVHEAAHAFAADRLGDPTPRSQGRLTLNPLKHLDPLGTVLLLLFRFGWGKPVIFDPYNLKHPRQDAALISIAGPASNILWAIVGSIVIYFLPSDISPVLYPFVFLNVGLAIFNLVPVHPLDGAKILLGLLPAEMAYEWEAIMNRYGIIILLLLIFPFSGVSPVIALISPIINIILKLLLPTAGLSI